MVTLETSHNPPGNVRMAINHHLQTVNQLAQCAAPRKRAADLKPSPPDDSGKEAAKCLRVTPNREQHGGVGRGTSKSLCRVPAQTPPCVLGLWSSTKIVLCCGAARQQDRSRLELLHGWNPLGENAVFLCFLLEDTRHERIRGDNEVLTKWQPRATQEVARSRHYRAAAGA